jgi:hypothetical protein
MSGFVSSSSAPPPVSSELPLVSGGTTDLLGAPRHLLGAASLHHGSHAAGLDRLAQHAAEFRGRAPSSLQPVLGDADAPRLGCHHCWDPRGASASA